MARFFQMVMDAGRGSQSAHNELIRSYTPVEKAAMNRLTGEEGGYLIPTEFNPAMLEGKAEVEVIRPRSVSWNMSGSVLRAPIPDNTQGAAGVTPFFGGFQAKWLGTDGESQPQSEPKFSSMQFIGHVLMAELVESYQFFSDLTAEGDEQLARLIGKCLGWHFEYAMLRGTGTGLIPIQGMLEHPAALAVSRNTGSDIKINDVANMAAKMVPAGWGTAIWMTHPKTLEKIVLFSTYLANAGMPGPSVGTLLGRPLFITEKLPALGTKGDLILIDPSHWITVERQEVMIDMSDQTLFSTGQVVLRATYRADAKSVLSSAVTLADGSETASSIVVLN